MAQIPYMNWMGNQHSGSAYDVYQYYLGGGSPGGTSTPTSGGGGGITSLPWYQQTGGGGGGGQSGLGGRYGNLDLSKTKNFTKDVWSQVGPPNQMGWAPKDVKGYYNPTLGNWQTLAGKNINHLGINVPSIVGGLFDKDWGKTMPGDIKGTFTEGWDEGLENIKEGSEEWFDAIKTKVGWGKKKAKKALDHKKHVAAIQEKERQREERKAEAARQAARQTRYEASKSSGREGGHWYGGSDYKGGASGDVQQAGPGRDKDDIMAEGGMVGDLTGDPEYRGWKKMYEANPEIGSMHEKHPTFIKFYKKHERDRKKFGGLAGLLYG